MFHLSISASLILQPPPAHAPSTAESIDVSVSPSVLCRWSADIFGASRLEANSTGNIDEDAVRSAQTFDIRVDWGSGEFSEVYGVPLAVDDRLIIDPCGEVHVSTEPDSVLAAVTSALR